jgi:hypothetical protein
MRRRMRAILEPAKIRDLHRRQLQETMAGPRTWVAQLPFRRPSRSISRPGLGKTLGRYFRYTAKESKTAAQVRASGAHYDWQDRKGCKIDASLGQFAQLNLDAAAKAESCDCDLAEELVPSDYDRMHGTHFSKPFSPAMAA